MLDFRSSGTVRDGASKGKIERFLSKKLDLSSRKVLIKQLTYWIEEDYNASGHSAISMSPISRFALDMIFIKFLDSPRVQIYGIDEDTATDQ